MRNPKHFAARLVVSMQMVSAFCILLSALAPPVRAADQDYSRQSARTSPPWLRDGVIYEIFPRDFSAAGNLNGVTARLDELKDLGVNILWIMPIHPIGEKARKGEYGSPYAVRDYYAVNPDYGTLTDFKTLVAEAHRRGLKVIMDLVANHTAWDNVLLNVNNRWISRPGAPGILQAGCRRKYHSAGTDLDRRGGAELPEPRVAGLHDCDDAILGAGLRH